MQKRILIVRTDRVGDVVMITPMLREFRRTFPDAFIATLTNPNTREILINNPHLDVTITDDLKKESFRNTVKEIRKHKFTHGLLVMPTERAAYQMFLGGVKERIGVGRKLYEVITFMKSVSRNKYIPLRHEADYCMDLARSLGVVTSNLMPEIFVTDGERSQGLQMLKESGVSENFFKVILHTGSGKSSSNWSEEKYFGLIKEILKKRNDIQIILTAKEMSEDFKNKVKKEYFDKTIIVEDKIKRLRDLICIISNADHLIAPSTGPLHIASALKIRTTGLYCHRLMNCAAHWGALGHRAINIEVSKKYCDENCSFDKEICNFENGISIQEVVASLNSDIRAG